MGMCGAGAMLLKGEGGTPKNLSAGMIWYEKAAAQDTVKALNGLGYIYFYGNEEIERNYTRALEYFQRAALTDTEPDSMFNTGYIYQHGLGVAKDPALAAQWYYKSANKFGHFSSIYVLGIMYMAGEGVARSTTEALKVYVIDVFYYYVLCVIM